MTTHESQDGAEAVQGIQTAPKPSRVQLTDKQIADYRHHREKLLKWSLSIGKRPDEAVGYAEDTIRVRAGHIDRFYRWMWDDQEGYTTQLTEEQADSYLKHLAYWDDISTSAANKYKKALMMLFRWRDWELGEEHDWDPALKFTTNDSSSQPRDYFTRDERQELREGVLRPYSRRGKQSTGTVCDSGAFSPRPKSRRSQQSIAPDR